MTPCGTRPAIGTPAPGARGRLESRIVAQPVLAQTWSGDDPSCELLVVGTNGRLFRATSPQPTGHHRSRACGRRPARTSSERPARHRTGTISSSSPEDSTVSSGGASSTRATSVPGRPPAGASSNDRPSRSSETGSLGLDHRDRQSDLASDMFLGTWSYVGGYFTGAPGSGVVYDESDALQRLRGRRSGWRRHAVGMVGVPRLVQPRRTDHR